MLLGRARRRQVILLAISMVMAVVTPLGVARASTAGGTALPRLAFVDGSQLRVVAADGSGERILAVASTPTVPTVAWDDVATPTWSPDGRRVAFSRSFGVTWLAPTTEVRVVGADGRNETTVLSLPGAGIIEELRWSPAGDRLAFLLYTPNPAGIVTWGAGSRWDLYVVDADGDGLRLVAPVHASAVRSLDWSPDGTRLAFVSDELGVPGVYTSNVDGLPVPTRLTPPDMVALDPRWSPDGHRLAFHGTKALSAEGVLPAATQLWTVAVDGRDLRALPARTWEPPSWSPDGRWLAYSCDMDACGINVISADGRRGRTLTPKPDRASDHLPVWSKQGTIAFVRLAHHCCVRHLWVMNGDGSGARRLTLAEDVDLRLAWSA